MSKLNNWYLLVPYNIRQELSMDSSCDGQKADSLYTIQRNKNAKMDTFKNFSSQYLSLCALSLLLKIILPLVLWLLHLCFAFVVIVALLVDYYLTNNS